MKTRLLFIGIIFFMSLTTSAVNEVVTLTIRQTDGKLANFELNEQPIITFTDNDLVITTQSNCFNYTLSTIELFNYQNVTEGIDIATIDGIIITQRDNLLIIQKLAKDKIVAIYSFDGKLLLSITSTDADPIIISTDNFPKGMYIVKADYVTFKTLKQ